jgi:hypothetical protein
LDQTLAPFVRQIYFARELKRVFDAMAQTGRGDYWEPSTKTRSLDAWNRLIAVVLSAPMARQFVLPHMRKFGIVLYALTTALPPTIMAISYGEHSPALAFVGLGTIAVAPLLLNIARRASVKTFFGYEAFEQYLSQHYRSSGKFDRMFPVDIRRRAIGRREPLFVFLREFASDAAFDDAGVGTDYMDQQIRRFPWAPRHFASQEERIANYFRRYGTVIAIGRPGELLPGGGSFRIYVDDDSWQSTAVRLINRADLILLRCGSAPGLSWELEQIIALNKLERTLIFLATKWRNSTQTLERLLMLLKLSGDRSNYYQTRVRVIQGLRELIQRDVKYNLFDSLKGELEYQERDKERHDQLLIQLCVFLRVKNGSLFPVVGDPKAPGHPRAAGQLQDALNGVTRDLGLRIKTWSAVKPWLCLVVFLSPILLLAPFLSCGGYMSKTAADNWRSALQQNHRGLFHTDYAGATLRENLAAQR